MGEGEGEEVEDAEEIHAGGKGDGVGEGDDALAAEEFAGYHGVAGEAPFVDDPGADEGEADEQGAEHIGGLPWVRVIARLKGNEAV